MDKTAWIAVTLCSIGLIYYLVVKPAERAKELRDNPPPAPAENAEPANGAEGGDAVQKGAGGNEGGENVVDGAGEKPAPNPEAPEDTHSISSDSVDYIFTSQGGGIKQAQLKDGKFVGEEPVILNEHGNGAIGTLSRDIGKLSNLPYALMSPKGEVPVIYEGMTKDGIQVTKTWTLSENEDAKGYLWELQMKLKNSSDAAITDQPLYLYMGTASPFETRDWPPPAVGWAGDGDADHEEAGHFQKSFFGDAHPHLENRFTLSLWSAVYNKFYAQMISPVGEAGKDVGNWGKLDMVTDPKRFDGEQGAGVHGAVGFAALSLGVGEEKTFDYEVYTGPRSYGVLKSLGQEREEVMFYGFFSMISVMFIKLLTTIEGWVHAIPGSWGIAIIIVTCLIRLVIWPLHAKSTRTMKRMALLGPKMTELKEKHADNPQKMNTEVMKLYRDYGVNPLGGCFPVLLQFPIFLGYFYMLRSAVEMSGESFLWVKDLALPDTQFHIGSLPINPLPLLMAITMFIQMKMTPKSTDQTAQMQQKIFMIMPVIFLLMCYGFASALALYWTAQNIFSIGQTYIMSKMDAPVLEKKERPKLGAPPAGGQPEKKKKKPPPKTGGGKGRKK